MASVFLAFGALADEQAKAQADDLPVVGVIIDGNKSNLAYRGMIDRLRSALDERGQIENETYRLQVEYTNGYTEYLPPRLTELYSAKPAVIVSAGNNETNALLDVESSIPIVMAPNYDAELFGFVGNLDEPEGRVTGISIAEAALLEDEIELIRAVDADASSVSLLGDTYTEFGKARTRRAEEVIEAHDMDVRVYGAERSQEVADALVEIFSADADALIVLDGFITNKNSQLIAWRAEDAGLLTVSDMREMSENGMAISTLPTRADLQDIVSDYVVAILDGKSVSELPVHVLAEPEIAVNTATMAKLGLSLPDDVLATAVQID